MTPKQKENLIDPQLLKSKQFKREQVKVFLITVVLYCTWHAARTAWAYSKKSVKETDPYFSDGKLGIFDMCFMLAYAFGLFFNGWLGDKSNLKSFVTTGAIISLTGYFTFAVLARNEMQNIYVFGLCFLLHGFGQSRGFPGNIAILAHWIEPAKRGFLLGLWNASINIGNIMGQQIGRFVIEVYHIHWTYALFIAGGTMILMGLVMFVFLHVSPKAAGIEIAYEMEDEESNFESHSQNNDQTQGKPSEQESQSVGFWAAWKTPGLIKYSLVFACIKGSTYGLLFWLPDFLQTVMHFGDMTAVITAAYEFGQFLGAIVLGHSTDKMKKRSAVIVLALYISSCIFIILALLGSECTVLAFALILFCAGIFFGGPEAIVGGVISSDLGESVTLKSEKRSMATMAGIIDGVGSIGAAFVQMIIPHFKAESFYIYFGLCFLAAILMTPTAIKDFGRKESVQNESNYPNPPQSKLIEMQTRCRTPLLPREEKYRES